MMFRAQELKQNVCGLMDAWADGGYSEDWASHSLARYHGRTLCVPKAALFPTELGEVSWPRLINYLGRQLFVLTSTWASPHQRYLAYTAQWYNSTMCAVTVAAIAAVAPLSLLLAACTTCMNGLPRDMRRPSALKLELLRRLMAMSHLDGIGAAPCSADRAKIVMESLCSSDPLRTN